MFDFLFAYTKLDFNILGLLSKFMFTIFWNTVYKAHNWADGRMNFSFNSKKE